MRLLQIILLIVLVYYLVTKYILPYLLTVFIRKAQENFQQSQRGNHSQPIRKEGEIKVDYVPPTAKKTGFNPTEAEDVDFEEIKDNSK
jgi:hypothetical protein